MSSPTVRTETRPRPPWPRKKLELSPEVHGLKEILRRNQVRTVCEDAKCPNISECFSRREATFIILGDRCTRSCGFCAIPTGKPLPPDPAEPTRLASAAQQMGLTHCVITAVARDDLADGGAAHFAACITAVRTASPDTTVEVLTSDLKGDRGALRQIADCDVQIFNHNVETVERLHRVVRPQAKYARSLELLRDFKQMRPDTLTKSGIMLGLGEEDDEVETTLRDMRSHGVDIVTIGQYMQPMRDNLDVLDYAPLERFERFERIGDALGFRLTLSGPYVRSSFGAADAARVLGVLRDGREAATPRITG